MKHVRKALAFVMALVMALAVVTPAFAQDGAATTPKGSITINNAAKGETYKIYKLFSATVDPANHEHVSYSGTIPSGLTSFFEADDDGNVTAIESALIDANASGEAKLTEAARTALKTWAASQSPTATQDGNGGSIVFENLELGYYVVTTTQDEGNFISIDTTNLDVTINDKNDTTPVEDLKKRITKVGNTAVTDADGNAVVAAKVGDTLTYTVTFNTANYIGTDKIYQYVISDTLAAAGLDRDTITVTGIKVGTTDLELQQFDTNNTITIDWTNDGTVNGTSLYDNGAQLQITYTGVVAAAAATNGNGNTNTVTVQPYYGSGSIPENDPYKTTASKTFYTYAFAIKKVDGKDGHALSGAVFQLPFYVNENAATDGAYVYAGTKAGAGLTNQLTTPDNGLIVVKGLDGTAYDITEITPPQGYNKVNDAIAVTPVKQAGTKTETTVYYDANGNKVDEETENGFEVVVSIDKIAATPVVVTNNAGTEMPSTGGIGTTIFYVVGGVMVAGAVVFLLTKRRVAAE